MNIGSGREPIAIAMWVFSSLLERSVAAVRMAFNNLTRPSLLQLEFIFGSEMTDLLLLASLRRSILRSFKTTLTHPRTGG